MTTSYFNQHYPTVYPIAHCNAIIAQAQLLNAFAKRNGFGPVPMLAFDLVFPDSERRDALNKLLPIPMIVRQLRFNQAEFDHGVTGAVIELALRIFEKGGYSYKDPNSLLSDAVAFVRLSRPERLTALRLQNISSCQSVTTDGLSK